MGFYYLHRSQAENLTVKLSGLDANYLPWVVIDADRDRVVSSHMSSLAAREQVDVLKNGRQRYVDVRK